MFVNIAKVKLLLKRKNIHSYVISINQFQSFSATYILKMVFYL